MMMEKSCDKQICVLVSDGTRIETPSFFYFSGLGFLASKPGYPGL